LVTPEASLILAAVTSGARNGESGGSFMSPTTTKRLLGRVRAAMIAAAALLSNASLRRGL
jgi:hypothetical protein